MKPPAAASSVAGALRSIAVPLGVTIAVQAMLSFAALGVPVLAPDMAAELGIAPTWVGSYAGALYLAAALSSAGAPRLIAPVGALTLSLACLLLAALGLGLMAVGGLPAAVIGTLLIGLGYGAANPTSSEILAPRTPAALRALVFSLKQTGVPIGGMLAGMLVPAALLLAGWRGAALAVALLALLLAAGLAPLRPSLDGPRPGAPPPAAGAPPRRADESTLRLVLGEPRLRRLALASFVFAAMQVSMTSFLVVQLVDRARLDVTAAGLLLSLALVAGVAGRIAWGWVADRFAAGRGVLVALAAAMSAFALLMGSVGPAWPYALLALQCIAFGGTAVAWNGVFIAEVVRLAPVGRAAAATGGALAVTYAGVVAGAPLFGLVVELSGSYAAAYGALAALTLLGGWLVWRAR